MKKYLIEILVLACVFLGPLYMLQAIVDIRARNNYLNGTYRTLNTALDKKVDADIVIFGNSRAQCHFDTHVMDSVLSVNCFNMGLSGFPFDIQYHQVIKPYLQKNTTPKLIIYEISPQACLEHWNSIFQYSFLPYINDKHYDYYLGICDEISRIDRILPFKYRGRSIKSFYHELNSEFGKDDGKDCFTPHNRTGYSLNFITDSIYRVENNPQIVSQFQEFVQDCKENSIELLFVTTPMHEEDFFNHCHTNEFMMMVDTLSNWTNRLDYSLMFKSDTTYFVESTHLNAYGASIFSKKCAEDIKELYGSFLNKPEGQ